MDFDKKLPKVENGWMTDHSDFDGDSVENPDLVSQMQIYLKNMQLESKNIWTTYQLWHARKVGWV